MTAACQAFGAKNPFHSIRFLMYGRNGFSIILCNSSGRRKNRGKSLLISMLLPLLLHRTACPLGYEHPMLLARPRPDKKMCRPELLLFPYDFRRLAKSAIASEILICCGQTASQLLQPIQESGRLSSASVPTTIGAINPPPVNWCSL